MDTANNANRAAPESPGPQDVAIEVNHLSKIFRIRHHGFSLKGALVHSVKGVVNTARQIGKEMAKGEAPIDPNPHIENKRAVRDLSFTVPHGQTLAVIGRNGSGKSTLLGILARVYKPTEGFVRLYNTQGGPARIAPLLALGAGFHPELTGDENIEFYGAVLGLSAKEVRAKRDSIIEFAELQDKADTQIHSWNDGAKLRLGFAIAVHTDPDILLVDEVLAVGDEAFQNKCYRLIHQLQAEGKTILFVSHDLAVVERVADRILWMNQGVIHRDGEVATVLGEYRAASTGEGS